MKNFQSKRLTLLLVAFLWACHSPDQKWDSKSSADTLNNMKDSAFDSSKSMTKALVMKVSKDDAKFAVEAADGGLTEVELGQLALAKAVSPAVKEFGAMMVKDHAKANEQLKTLAKNKGITLPQTMSRYNQQIKNELKFKSGQSFDKAYVQAMIKDHKDDIESFQSAVKDLQDTDLKKFAAGTLPVLKKHLDAIENRPVDEVNGSRLFRYH